MIIGIALCDVCGGPADMASCDGAGVGRNRDHDVVLDGPGRRAAAAGTRQSRASNLSGTRVVLEIPCRACVCECSRFYGERVLRTLERCKNNRRYRRANTRIHRFFTMFFLAELVLNMFGHW